ncbi:MAG: PilZ domain-containing protein [Bacteriovoracales bacterium]
MVKERENLTDQLEIYNLLRRLQTSKVTFWVFQELEELTDTSPIHLARLTKVEYDKIEARPATGNSFTFHKDDNVMFFYRDEELAFKAKITHSHPEIFDIPFPTEVFSTNESDLEKVPIFKKIVTTFREKRSESRKTPKAKKIVVISKETGTAFQKGIPKRFELLDLSLSGMGIKTVVVDDFQIGDEIEVRSIDGKEELGIIFGEVKSVRELEGGGFKVGILFLSRAEKKAKAQ